MRDVLSQSGVHLTHHVRCSLPNTSFPSPSASCNEHRKSNDTSDEFDQKSLLAKAKPPVADYTFRDAPSQKRKLPHSEPRSADINRVVLHAFPQTAGGYKVCLDQEYSGHRWEVCFFNLQNNLLGLALTQYRYTTAFAIFEALWDVRREKEYHRT